MRRLLPLLAAPALVLCAAPVAGAEPRGAAPVDPHTLAVIGDLPYGQQITAQLPEIIEQIDAAGPAVTVHVGDIKSGSSRCDDEPIRDLAATFDTVESAFVFTPGDNEWTDCHRANNGGYQPLERLSYLRSVFFPEPGRTLGERAMKVDAQTAAGFPENVRWKDRGVQFATLHVVGSNDDLAPWTGLGLSAPTPEQVAEQEARMANAVSQVRATFADATRRHDRAVALFLQADMFDPSAVDPQPAAFSAFRPLVQALVAETEAFDGEVYLFNGDSHVFTDDRPLAAGSRWLDLYDVQGSADALRRVTVDGSENADKDWLRVTVTRPGSGPALVWEQVPLDLQ